jgi:hypothetical protein
MDRETETDAGNQYEMYIRVEFRLKIVYIKNLDKN